MVKLFAIDYIYTINSCYHIGIYLTFSAASKPDSVGYEEVNATAVKITWTIPGNLNGFIITVSTGSLDPVTAQLTDGTVREFVVDHQLSPETDYIIEVRGYYELLGPAGVVSVTRLEGILCVYLPFLN